jgi:hypothetical protein
MTGELRLEVQNATDEQDQMASPAAASCARCGARSSTRGG